MPTPPPPATAGLKYGTELVTTDKKKGCREGRQVGIEFEPKKPSLGSCGHKCASHCKESKLCSGYGGYASPGAAQAVHELAFDPELRVVIDAWEDLPHSVRAGILAMIDATRAGTDPV